MRDAFDDALGRDLGDLYRRQRAADPLAADGRDAHMAECVLICEKELASLDRAPDSRKQAMGFLRTQMRFVRPATWAAFALIAAFVAVVCRMQDGAVSSPQLLSTAGALLALTCLMSVTRAKAFGMAELESACPFNAVSVALAHLLMMGAASALVLVIGALSLGDQGAVQGVLWMGAPYLVACAGGLMCARRASSADSRTAAMVWAACAVAVSALLYFAAPSAYASAVVWVWALVFAGAGVWCVAEVRAWIACSAGGFVSQLSPTRA